jgi:hypothetical protein
MNRLFPLTALVLGFLGCQPTPPDPVTPVPAPDSASCDDMCKHIGPKDQGGLGCEEGSPVYDSDVPGPKDVPNESCGDFCRKQQAQGVHLNPKCVVKVTSCDQIDTAMRSTCD